MRNGVVCLMILLLAFAFHYYSPAVINLDCLLVFYFKSFFHVLSSRERTKAPGTRKGQSAGFLFTSCKQHLSVKPTLPLKLFF